MESAGVDRPNRIAILNPLSVGQPASFVGGATGVLARPGKGAGVQVAELETRRGCSALNLELYSRPWMTGEDARRSTNRKVEFEGVPLGRQQLKLNFIFFKLTFVLASPRIAD